VIKHPYNVQLWNRLRKFPQSRWISEDRMWLIPYTLQHIERLIVLFKDCEIRVDELLLQECYLLKGLDVIRGDANENSSTVVLEKSEWGSFIESKLIFELKLRGYSLRTSKAYCGHVERFYRYYGNNRELSTLDVISAFSHQLLSEQLSHSYVNQAISAIKFYMEKVCGMLESSFPFVRPKKEHKLPNVLGQNEVMSLLSVVENQKHRAIIYIIYSSGLRVGEVVRLRVNDIDRERKTLHIRQSKGKKDRLTVLSDAALEVINPYLNLCKPSAWLFPGQYPIHI